MAYTDDAVLSKLSSLNETQESIVTVAQWVMFHRRHADRTGQLWLQRLKDSSSNKRLNLIYLANEVAQQSKARHKDDFLTAFSPVIAEATAVAYKGASGEVQGKLKRVVSVWRERQVFETPIQDAIEARIEELDKTRSTTQQNGGGSLFGSKTGTPVELEPLVKPQQALSKSLLTAKTPLLNAKQDYEKMMDSAAVIPSPPVHAARLNGLLKTLAVAEGAVSESIRARKQLIAGLEKILQTNQATLREEEARFEELSNRRAEVDTKKRDVEISIMRQYGDNNPSTPTESPGMKNSPPAEPDRPEVETLTPPTIAHHSVGPVPEFQLQDSSKQNTSLTSEHSTRDSTWTQPHESVAGADLLSSLSGSNSYGGVYGGGSLKKRKLNPGEEIPDFGDELDPDVTAMLNS
ncbi:RNA polymerase II-binding domain-containing protein [Bisporella sp. PMI_857]|nr:RNA polymerase II-binding domain-containing protein [Bisporella sp. PMI_857]